MSSLLLFSDVAVHSFLVCCAVGMAYYTFVSLTLFKKCWCLTGNPRISAWQTGI